jgi:plasmid stabilization system protein ParE
LLFVDSAAATDAASASSWYESERSGLGIQFLFELDVAIGRAADNPFAYACVFKNFRRVLMRRFPYAVYFIADEDVVRIVAVLHQQRRGLR